MSGSSDFAGSVQDLAAAILAIASDPADALRLLVALADFTPDSVVTDAPIGVAMVSMAGAVSDLCRRAAATALARASAAYEPASYDDAARVRGLVCGVLDAEILIAADRGQDATYRAFRALRTAVAQDLAARGADLSPIAEVVTPQPLPALALAQRVYRDPARTDELVTFADPPHPAFMPVSFKALAK